MRKKEFIKLYDDLAPHIYRFVSLKVNAVADAEDLSSEAFFKFWQNFSQVKKIENPRALLYKIANNLVIDFYRRKPKTALAIDPENARVSKISDGTNLDKTVGQNLEMERVKKAIGEIKQEYQDLIIWRYLDELSVREIAQMTGKTENSVRVLAHRAMKALKQKM